MMCHEIDRSAWRRNEEAKCGATHPVDAQVGLLNDLGKGR